MICKGAMPPSVYVPGLLTLMPWLRARGDLVPCWRRRRPNVILIASPPISSWLHPTAHVNMDHNCIEQQINANDGYLLPKGLDNERSQADGLHGQGRPGRSPTTRPYGHGLRSEFGDGMGRNYRSAGMTTRARVDRPWRGPRYDDSQNRYH